MRLRFPGFAVHLVKNPEENTQYDKASREGNLGIWLGLGVVKGVPTTKDDGVEPWTA